MDCPHGNWWFYVWHRGYVGYFEQTIRALSGDDNFAMPYWDWTQHWDPDPSMSPQIPDGMFNGVLTPTDKAYERYTGNLAKFTSCIQPELKKYWDTLSQAQRAQLDTRGYKAFDGLWNDVTGFTEYYKNVKFNDGITGNQAFATTWSARYLSRDNPKFDYKTKFNVNPEMIRAGLLAPLFNNSNAYLSFTSSKTPSHNSPPGGRESFSTLEGFPHNKVHNYIGGAGSIDPGPYGNMTNNLSPVDPIFFLHHSNMDRLWDVWTRKQQSIGQPYLPTGQDLKTFSQEPFLFYVDPKGNYIGPSSADNYLSTGVFDYDYEPGSGEEVVGKPSPALAANRAATPVQGKVLQANVGSVEVLGTMIQSHLAGTNERPLMAEITLSGPGERSEGREFDVYTRKPPDGYAGTFAFFGPMMPGMKMSPDVTFAFPLPNKTLQAFKGLGAANNATVEIWVVSSEGPGAPAPVLKAVSVGAL
jgi:tyrosinase